MTLTIKKNGMFWWLWIDGNIYRGRFWDTRQDAEGSDEYKYFKELTNEDN